VKLAGSNRGKKLSSENLARLAGNHTFTREETQGMNRQALAVIAEPPEFDESDSPFFARDKGVTNLNEGEIAALDAMIEARGVADVLKSIEGLLESRIEEGVMQGGMMLLHLSRHDAWARAAERLRDLAFHPDIAEL
jgi:hypothetical protein